MFGKKTFYVFLSIFALLFSYCSKDQADKDIVKNISLSKEHVNLLIGQKEKLAILSGNGSYKVSSEDVSVAAVSLLDDFIEIEAKAQGKTKIIITDKKNQTQSLLVTVWQEVALEKDEVFLAKNATSSVVILSGSGQYQVDTNKQNVVTVTLQNKNVILEGKEVGQADVTITDIHTQKATSFKVNVSELVVDKTDEMQLIVADEASINITAGSGNYSATSDNQDIASVVLTGTVAKIIAKNQGKAVISIKDEKTAEVIALKVVVKTLDLELSAQHVIVKQQSRTILEILQGSNAYTVEVHDSQIATVSLVANTITIEGKKIGATFLKVIDTVSGKHQVVHIGVTPDYYDMDNLSMRGLTLELQEHAQESLTIFSGNPTFVVKDPSIVQAQIIVDQYGDVYLHTKGLRVGSTSIEVSQGDKKQVVQVKITPMPTFSLSTKSYEFSFEGENFAGEIKGSTQYEILYQDNSNEMIEVSIREGMFDITLNKKVSGSVISVIIKDKVQQKQETIILKVK